MAALQVMEEMQEMVVQDSRQEVLEVRVVLRRWVPEVTHRVHLSEDLSDLVQE
jgi:hypothetical protein